MYSPKELRNSIGDLRYSPKRKPKSETVTRTYVIKARRSELAVSDESPFQIHPKTAIFIAASRNERCPILGTSVREQLPHADRKS